MLSSRQIALTLLLLTTACGGGDTIGPPAALEIVAGNNQSVVVGEVVPLSPTIKVRDANGHGLPAIVVRFTVTGGGGFISVDSALTDNNGLAVAGQWTVGVVVGSNSLKAQASGLTISTTITATTRAGHPPIWRSQDNRTLRHSSTKPSPANPWCWSPMPSPIRWPGLSSPMP